ncbi:MAG: hypothetical protein BWY96_01095 [Spirochaetes bacterium ADurb.BinA120]|nr:MAG: hypothetical protein BWY96_01095 [Spirochaetes bacterium ADurb.BinA120]
MAKGASHEARRADRRQLPSRVVPGAGAATVIGYVLRRNGPGHAGRRLLSGTGSQRRRPGDRLCRAGLGGRPGVRVGKRLDDRPAHRHVRRHQRRLRHQRRGPDRRADGPRRRRGQPRVPVQLLASGDSPGAGGLHVPGPRSQRQRAGRRLHHRLVGQLLPVHLGRRPRLAAAGTGQGDRPGGQRGGHHRGQAPGGLGLLSPHDLEVERSHRPHTQPVGARGGPGRQRLRRGRGVASHRRGPAVHRVPMERPRGHDGPGHARRRHPLHRLGGQQRRTDRGLVGQPVRDAGVRVRRRADVRPERPAGARLALVAGMRLRHQRRRADCRRGVRLGLGQRARVPAHARSPGPVGGADRGERHHRRGRQPHVQRHLQRRGGGGRLHAGRHRHPRHGPGRLQQGHRAGGRGRGQRRQGPHGDLPRDRPRRELGRGRQRPLQRHAGGGGGPRHRRQRRGRGQPGHVRRLAGPHAHRGTRPAA